MFDLFFQQYHLLNLILLGVYVKRCPKCVGIQKKDSSSPKSD